MEKRKYITPAMKVRRIKTPLILAGSTEGSASVSPTESESQEAKPFNDYIILPEQEE